jgi:hypothetical protein
LRLSFGFSLSLCCFGAIVQMLARCTTRACIITANSGGEFDVWGLCGRSLWRGHSSLSSQPGVKGNQARNVERQAEARRDDDDGALRIRDIIDIGIIMIILAPRWAPGVIRHLSKSFLDTRRARATAPVGSSPSLADDLHSFRRMDVRLGPLERGFEFIKVLNTPEARERRPLFVRAHLRKLPEAHLQAALTKLEPQRVARVPSLFRRQ